MLPAPAPPMLLERTAIWPLPSAAPARRRGGAPTHLGDGAAQVAVRAHQLQVAVSLDLVQEPLQKRQMGGQSRAVQVS